ncbi:hypothetical protein HJC23_013898 [Cyclotella cryptica]|uniref:DUF4200 domain-containing protein n=1 Tax=Cyclotella cryptica TaxID=29204 RepID=A0ABD3QG93_9STRA|eukprot:CCRYP_005482-RA/>CCRYP_005482-RA protein AED:0.45 eAED:0.45 QI:0/-1/0/1/-1/1/1/0/379
MRKSVIENPFRIPHELESNLFELRKDDKPCRITSSIDRNCEKEPMRGTGARSRNLDPKNDTKRTQHSLMDTAKKVTSFETSYKDKGILSRHRPDSRMSINDFVTKRREMLLLNMKVNTQQEQIEKLRQQAKDRENALKAKEDSLDEKIKRFDLFMKEVDDKALNTERMAEGEYAKRAKKEQELKTLKHQLENVQSDIAKYTKTLDELLQFKQVVDSLTPASWFDDCLAEKRKRQQRRRRDRINARKEAFLKQKADAEAAENRSSLSERRAKNAKVADKTRTAGPKILPLPDFEDEPLTSSDEEYPMYFQSPDQLLDRFSDLENENLCYAKEVNEREATLRELKEQIRVTTNKLDSKANKADGFQNAYSTEDNAKSKQHI